MTDTLIPGPPPRPPADEPASPLAPEVLVPRERRPIRSYLLAVWSVGVYLWLFAPIVVLVAFSFNKQKGKFNTEWKGFTLSNWSGALDNKPEYTDTLITSLKVAAVACVVATVLGGLLALATSKYEFRGKGLVNILVVLPLTTPEIVMGSSLFTLFFSRNLSFGFGTVVIAHILFCVSFVAMTIQARIRGFDWTLEDAAMDLGSTPWQTFRKVTFPLILPGIGAAAMLSFALSIDDYIITSFVAGDSTETFPMRIFNANKVELPAQINVLATFILLVTLALMIAGSWRTIRKAATAG